MVDNLATGVSAFTSNVFLVEGERPVVVDAGANFDVVSRLRERVDHREAVVVTHGHPDHVENLEAIAAAFDVEGWGHDPSVVGIDHATSDEEHVRLGDHEYVALHTPGHADDHLCLYAGEAGVLFAGDLVFHGGGFGRTDLPEGDRTTLVESIGRLRDRIDPDLRELHAGHGPSVTNEPYDNVERAGRLARRG